ncbi:unnamed protein product, partial [Rotaria magnacalcarata]
ASQGGAQDQSSKKKGG